MKKWIFLKVLDVLNWLSEKVRDSLGVEIAPCRSSPVILSRTTQRETMRPLVNRTFSRRKLPYPIEIESGDTDGDVG